MSPDDIFDIFYAFDQDAEGGFYNDPNAGPTMRGILQSTYNDWLKANGLPAADVRNITDDQVRAIIYQMFWAAPHIDLIAAVAPATSVAVADFGENIGDTRPIKALQRRIGAPTVDGIIGTRTVSALHAAIANAGGDLAFTKIYNDDRAAWYRMHSPAADIVGLENRVERMNAYLREKFA